uniref:NACHT domain-containing protein n=2 Tax=Amphimedon queenslandica TaxID=400682 RepID=A0A1X7UJX8_AMPQE
MIDVCQWRASIGLWNYCQAASSRPANGHHSHSFKAAVDSKSSSTTPGEKTSKLPAALSLISLLLLFFHSLSLLRHILMIPPTGDVELNPGPMIDDQPDILLLLQWLEPLVDWQSFGTNDTPNSNTPVVSAVSSSASVINKPVTNTTSGNPKDILRTHSSKLTDAVSCNLLKIANELHASRLMPEQLRQEILVVAVDDYTKSTKLVNVIERQLKASLKPEQYLINICHVLINQQHRTLTDIATSILRQLGHSIPHNVSSHNVLPSPVDNIPNTPVTNIAGQSNVAKPISPIPDDVQGYPDNIRQHKHEPTLLLSPDDASNASATKEIAATAPITGNVASNTNTWEKLHNKIRTVFGHLPCNVQEFADNMRQHYKHQPIVATDWPPKIGKDYFGRLALVEKQDSSTQAESAWHMLRGQVDKTVKLTENKEISVEDILQPTDSSLSLRVVIDGPPGIGKTTLCRKLLNMWSSKTLVTQQYDLVLYCPLRNSKIAKANTLADLFEYKRYEVPMVAEWFEKRNGKRLLIIFDGWDELSEQLRQSSFAASIIHKKHLDQSSVIVTSRSYASSSLLKMDTLSKHVQVVGFSKEEISTVIIQTLQKDTKLAQELIDENTEQILPTLWQSSKYKSHFTTNQSSKDSQLAVKLINDLKVRNDIESLCYVPLVCSMVILVYCKKGGHLPTTLTQLYENFILQTIRRHAKRYDFNTDTLDSLSSLPSRLARPLQEMCQIAYTNLANTRMTFSSYQLQSLSEAVKEDYLGLMTKFIEYDEEKYQFLHLSIQEFLAAWWIAKHEKTEEVFKDHFDNDHFRMCLRFVAGLTRLEHESYQQYFNIQQLELQCKRKPLFKFQTCHLQYFYKNPKTRKKGRYMHAKSNYHVISEDRDNIPIFLLQLLYESQNITLCQVLAQSINNQSLCLDGVSLSLFDWLCLSYCINNSNTTWNHLHLSDLSNQPLSVFTAGLTNNSLQTQCKRLEVRLDESTNELILKLLKPPLYNIQECYCELFSGQYFPCVVLLQFLNLPQLKILHLMIKHPFIPRADSAYYKQKCIELEKSIKKNSTLQEMKIEYEDEGKRTSTITSVIRGVAQNKIIKSLSLYVSDFSCANSGILFCPPPLPDGVIEQLLKYNNTLQALSLNIPDELLPSSLNIVEVNTPLTALEIGGEWDSTEMTLLVIPYIKGLHCLILRDPYPPHLLFLSHPSLHTLTLPLDRAESAIELFTILQFNATLKALSVEIKEKRVYTSSVGTSLQDMLTQNQTLKYLEINSYRYFDDPTPSSFLSFLTTGLRHNTSLQQLSVPIPLMLVNEDIKTFFNVISQTNNLTEIEMNFKLDQSVDLSYSSLRSIWEKKEYLVKSLFYEQVLPVITSMLQSHTAIRLLKIKCEYVYDKQSQPNWVEQAHNFLEIIFMHPSLEYIEINALLLKDTFINHKKILIDRHKKEQPYKPLLIVKFDY